ncbi:hypothetical protein EPA93_15095 [Ktedonosporobacter rubrisoli]|uniref:Integrase catalytic domain-containing protein n=1 Tax=Ktedonosporobacter rubrisoli TaxID=2509675 RepID=A0A4P6JPE2_KTERU|nr:hypothetical protein EPA93_15095 [Ktedonosporobacter rubrisoli]
MSRKGNCWDNAPTESFFGTLKREWTHRLSYQTQAQARQSVLTREKRSPTASAVILRSVISVL